MNASEEDGPSFGPELAVLRMSGPIRWFAFRDRDGKVWRVCSTSHDLSPEMKGEPGTSGYDGLTDSAPGVILVDAAASRATQDYVTLHEVMHACVDGVDGVDGRAEEDVITKMAPRLYPVLKRFGLRWPVRTEEMKSFERSVRRSK